MTLLFTWTYIRTALLAAFIHISAGETGTLADSVAGDAVFAGGSSLVTSPVPGAVKFLVRSGESVRMGQAIAEVGMPDTAAAFQESLDFAKSRLAQYEKSTEAEFALLQDRVEPAYERAVNLFFEAQDLYAAGEVPSARAIEAELAGVSASLATDRERLLEMEGERARLAASVSAIAAAQKSSVVEILSPSSGTFLTEFYAVEQKLTVESLNGKDASELLSLAREAKDARSLSVKEGQMVVAGDIIGRVVTGQKVVFYLPVKTEERPSGASMGQAVDVVFTSTGAKESGTISAIDDGRPPGYSIIKGELPMVAEERMIHAGPISILVRSRTGVIVPKTAVMEKEGKTGVLLVQKTYARFQEVEVLMTKGDKTVVKGISAGEEIVVRASAFFEGKRVR